MSQICFLLIGIEIVDIGLKIQKKNSIAVGNCNKRKKIGVLHQRFAQNRCLIIC